MKKIDICSTFLSLKYIQMLSIFSNKSFLWLYAYTDCTNKILHCSQESVNVKNPHGFEINLRLIVRFACLDPADCQ